jgi:hypothetical protein
MQGHTALATLLDFIAELTVKHFPDLFHHVIHSYVFLG